MTTAPNTPMRGIDVLPTGIPGFDLLAMGGLPRNRTTLIAGTAGSAKTIFVTQFLVEGIRNANEPCVFVTLEESPDDIRRNMRSFGWDIARWEAEALWVFVDGTLALDPEDALIGDFDLGGLLARMEAAAARIGARRLAMDAVDALFSRLEHAKTIRAELFRISRAFRNMGVTALMTGERSSEDGEVTRNGFEEFVADNVVILRNGLEAELRRRTLEILKLRGMAHRRGEYPLVITDGRGIEVVPLSAIALEHQSSDIRVPFGNPGLDQMCHGGPFRDATLLVSGPSGSGKTLIATTFAAGSAAAGERCLFLGFEESHDQLRRNAAGWGLDLERMEAQGLLRVLCEYPESSSLEDRLSHIKDTIADFQPQRLVIDSISSLRRIASKKGLRDFAIGLTSYTKQAHISLLLTADISHVFDGSVITDDQTSVLSDSIILLRYVEIGSQIYRGVTVLKMRGSSHDTAIREFTIDNTGMHVGSAFRQVDGVLTGSAKPARGRRNRGGASTTHRAR